MRTIEKMKWGVIGVLLLAAALFCFLIHPVFGAVMLLFMAIVFYWMYTGYKRPVDAILKKIARKYHFQVLKNPFTYNALAGEYRGNRFHVDFVSDWEYGTGIPAAWLSEQANMVLIDMKNFLRIRMETELPAKKETIIKSDWPSVVRKKNELIYMAPFGVGEKPSQKMIIRGIENLMRIGQDQREVLEAVM